MYVYAYVYTCAYVCVYVYVYVYVDVFAYECLPNWLAPIMSQNRFLARRSSFATGQPMTGPWVSDEHSRHLSGGRRRRSGSGRELLENDFKTM